MVFVFNFNPEFPQWGTKGLRDKLKSFMQQKENDNLKAGEAFLADNAKRESVVTLPSGLQYEIIKQGDGPKPSASNTVTCHYHGTTIHGDVFDSSVRRGQPASFPLNAVIKGWTEALQLMPVGSKWKLFLPSHLAYGNRNVSREIGPNSTLIFEVELLSFR
ncbi:MAG TPA: FKBP-type peptidyl-prolyl cis-trans isomerase [Chitinophagaceae bacterium]|nr:FKBP-type peptidyl-prolyl cis-trans isomerase [Chitinophagaceae bacterium]